MTGEQLESDIYIGPTYYMRLKHMVKDKINYRARGPNTGLTKQPVQGRANDGGLRIGEMERDGVLAHGMSYFLNESFLKRADEYFIAVCNKSGTLAIYNESRNLFLSPYVDGPLKFHKNPDDSMNIENISRFGRSFSVLKVPYAFKLLIQELQVMNVQMRIITDQNVDQLTSMSYSNNILKLTQPTSSSGDKQSKDISLEIMRLNTLMANPNTGSYNIKDKAVEAIPDYAPILPDAYQQQQQPGTIQEPQYIEDILKISDEQKKYKLLPNESDEKMVLTDEMLIDPTEAFYKKEIMEDGSERVTNVFTGYKSIITSMDKEDQLYLIQQPIAIQNRILKEIYYNYGKALLTQKQLFNENKEKTPYLKSKHEVNVADHTEIDSGNLEESNWSIDQPSSKSFHLDTDSIETASDNINNQSPNSVHRPNSDSPPWAIETPDDATNTLEEIDILDIEPDQNETEEEKEESETNNDGKKVIELKINTP
jgi:hypothetical protein